MHENNEMYITSIKQMVALGFLGVAGNMSPFILPLIVGALVDYVDFSIQQASYIASADMFGLGAGTLLWSRFILTADWRKFAVASAVLLFVGNVLCAVTDTFSAVILSRFVAGIGAGLMLAIGVSGLSNTRNPDRVVAIYMILVTMVASLVLYVFPFLLVQSGSRGMFFALAGFACLAGVSSFFVPRVSKRIDQSDTQIEEVATPSSSRSGSFFVVSLLGVSGVLVVFFGMSLYWVYIERAGVLQGFVTEQMSAGLGTAQFAGVAGALAAAVISTRFGNRMVPVMFTLGLALIASLLVPTTTGFVFFVLSAGALIFAWDMLYPYVIGIMVSLDATARLVTYSMVMMTLGKSLSPAIGAFIVTETDYSGAYWLCVACFLLSAILFIPALLITDKKLKST